jgi:hypothetical protein
MDKSNYYLVTAHRGRGLDSRDAEVIFEHLDQGLVMTFYRQCTPVRPGWTVAVWSPDRRLIAITAGEPEP